MTTIHFDERKLTLVLEDLPALQGSAKQVAWAEEIRAGLFDFQVRQRFDSVRTKSDTSANFIEKAVDTLNRGMAPFFDTATSAKFWIDNRNGDLGAMAKR